MNPSDTLRSSPLSATERHSGIESGTAPSTEGYPEGTEVYAVDYLYDGQRYTTRVLVGPHLSNHPTAFEDIRKILAVRLTGHPAPAAITVESLVLL